MLATMLSRMIRALKLDASVFEEVEHDQTAMGQAALVVVLVSLIGSFGGLFKAGVLAMIAGLIMALVGWIVWSSVTWLVGTMVFGGKAQLGEMLRALGFAYTPGVFNIIPFIGWLIALAWTIATFIVAVRQALDFTTGKAVATVVISFIAYVVVMVILTIVLGMLGLGAGLATGALAPS
jgi:hypothetical protein